MAGTEQCLTRPRQLLLVTVPAVCLLALATNERHGLFLSNARLVTLDSLAQVVAETGPAMAIYYLNAYLVATIGAYVLVPTLPRSGAHRWQSGVALLGFTLTIGASVLDWTRLSPVPQIELTPWGLAIAVPLFVGTLIRARRADIVPIARNKIVQLMLDPVLVLDVEDHIIDMNLAAEEITGRRLAQALGKTMAEVWPAWASQADPGAQIAADRREIGLGEGAQQRVFDARRTELSDGRGRCISRVIVLRDITERASSEARLHASLQEKEVLLKEIHHRVKNNLQIIISLLSLQSHSTDDPFTLAQFRDSQNRILSMALIHERLYRSEDLARIAFEPYAQDLARHLLRSYRAGDNTVALTVQAAGVHLDIDTAVPCGLLTSELVSNALKHAFPNGRAGTVSVAMRRISASGYELVVADDGVGFPAEVDFRKTTSLGLQLVNSLARQLDGTVIKDEGAGTRFAIRFPVGATKEK